MFSMYSTVNSPFRCTDDRFIAKELTKPELQTMETFAPAYFDYMSSAITDNVRYRSYHYCMLLILFSIFQRPTLLAKVFGCYKITFKKTNKDRVPAKSKSTQMNLLVMENLFYDRRFSKVFSIFIRSLDNADKFCRSMISKAQRGTAMSSPLVGRTRFSWTRTWSKVSKYLRYSITLSYHMYTSAAHLSPFYLREHSKRILRGALYNDSKFLADINVMDYSLVVGVDSQRNELVVGIVGELQSKCFDRDGC